MIHQTEKERTGLALSTLSIKFTELCSSLAWYLIGIDNCKEIFTF